MAGNNPDKKAIFGSYSDDLGVRTNTELQRIYSTRAFKGIFPGTRISEAHTNSDKWKRNENLIEYANRGGSFRNTTVAGQVNGLELHLGVIDDPLKGRAEAHSPTIRDKTWEWFADDFMSRFAKDGALLIVMTRWHVDDMLGRFIAKFKDEVPVLRYPAIAEHDELHRKKGEALFPELKPLDFLLERRKLLTEAGAARRAPRARSACWRATPSTPTRSRATRCSAPSRLRRRSRAATSGWSPASG